MRKKILLIGILVSILTGAIGCVAVPPSTPSTPSHSSSSSIDNGSAQAPLDSDGSDETSGGSDSGSDGSDETSGGSDSGNEDDQNQYCTVTFDTDGGTAIHAIEVKRGEKITAPKNPTKSSANAEYEFLGWYYGEKAWDFANDTVTGDMTLTAKWKVVESYTKPFLPKD